MGPDMDSVLLRELLPGERLLWSGRPDPRRLWSVFAIWLFAVPWTTFALFWEAMATLPWFAGKGMPDALRLGFGVVFPLFGLPFIAIGVVMLAMPLRALARARVTAYGLTERRLFSVTAGTSRSATSVLIDQMGPIEVRAGRDGCGTLRVQTGSRVDCDGDRVTERFEVAAVADVSRLEGLLLDLRSRRATHRAGGRLTGLAQS